jgi:hypothetical protein
MVVYLYESPHGGELPNYTVRRKIENQVRRSAHEHLVIYANRELGRQIWQWVRREPGTPTACREHTYSTTQQGDALIEKLERVAFSLAEEDSLNITTVVGRARDAFDVEHVTRRFYDRFKREHDSFLRFIEGIKAQGDREWYASLMLNRLMFVYFIQKKGFLDGDPDYLRHRLVMMQTTRGKDQFLSFYRHFALRLFHEGLGSEHHDEELDALLGDVPYINGGLFDVHKLERQNPDIEIPDLAFEKVFDFFDAYQWHLDERPLRADNEINPDVLGYIFEKYINQKQMGAYYTKEDITEYIAKTAVVPFVLEAAREQCEIAFEKGSALWRLLQSEPDRYIYEASRRGVAEPLPADVAAGLNDLSARVGWNQPAPESLSLPNETWRDVIARRLRLDDIRTELADGKLHDPDRLVTLNLNLRQFCQDIIENSEGPELVRAVYQAVSEISILDPTCGSGAFLFAALNVLEPLYEACLDRMQSFVDEFSATTARRGDHFADFRALLERVAEHPNRRYFVLKSIILNNLYGVDIMEEAVEICKLRLFLKLVAQVDSVAAIEPLPDIDFNIRAGNSLVGFIDYASVKAAVLGKAQSRLDLGGDMELIDKRGGRAEEAFVRFREIQTRSGLNSSQLSDAKHELAERLQDLRDELDRYLSSEYGVPADNQVKRDAWKESHRPFHWWVEFYGIVKTGGFDVVIGNPPYVEYSKVRGEYTVRGLESIDSGNLYSYIIERSLQLQSPGGRFGMIIQLAAFCTPRMAPLQEVWFKNVAVTHLAFFDNRPGRLFDGADIRLVIALGKVGPSLCRIATSRYIRFATEERPTLFDSLWYQVGDSPRRGSSVLKLSAPIENSIVKKLWDRSTVLWDYVDAPESQNFVYYGYGFRYWGKVLNFKSFFQGELTDASTGDKYLYCVDNIDRDVIVALMNSSLFYWFYVNYSDGHNFTKHVIGALPFTYPKAQLAKCLKARCKELMVDLKSNARRKVAEYQSTGRVEYDEFVQRLSKPIIDKIDVLLGELYGLSPEEVDFLTNYDTKYRLGVVDADDGE